MEDLGSLPSLADVLLDPAASGVRQVLADWAQTCGRLAAWSTRPGGRADLARLYESHAGTGGESGTGGGSGTGGLGKAVRSAPVMLGKAVRSAPVMLGWAGVADPDGLDAEVAALAEFRTDRPRAAAVPLADAARFACRRERVPRPRRGDVRPAGGHLALAGAVAAGVPRPDLAVSRREPTAAVGPARCPPPAGHPCAAASAGTGRASTSTGTGRGRSAGRTAG
jgi:hypothetical protein